MYRGAAFVQTQLQHWDMISTADVGFELLVPALLDDLKREGLFFDFAGREELLKLKNKKKTGFQTETAGTQPTRGRPRRKPTKRLGVSPCPSPSDVLWPHGDDLPQSLRMLESI